MCKISLHDVPLSVHGNSLFEANVALFAIIITFLSKVFCMLRYWIYPPAILPRNSIKLKITEKCCSLWWAFLPFFVWIARRIFFIRACAHELMCFFNKRQSWGKQARSFDLDLRPRRWLRYLLFWRQC